MNKRAEQRTAPLVAILGLGLLLRLIALRTRGIWYDDAFSILLSRREVTRIVAGTAADTMPPLYYFLLHAWMGLGTGIPTLRLLNVLLSLGIIALTYRATFSLLENRRAALWAALFAAVSPFHIYHAQELRMYGLLCANLLLYLYFFIRIYLRLDRQGWFSWIGLTVAGALAMYSHNLALFSLLGADFLLLLKRRWRLLGRLLLAHALSFLLAAPWLVMVPGQVAKIQRAFWTPRPGLLELVQTLIVFHTNLPVPRWMLPISLAGAMLFPTFVVYELVRRRWRHLGVQLLAVFSLLPPALTFAASYLMRPLFVPRGIILSSLTYYMLGGHVVSDQHRRWTHAVLALIFVIPALLALPSHYTFDEFPRSRFEQAAAFLRAHVHPGDVVLHDNKLSYFPMHCYAPELPQVFLPDEPGSHNDTLARASQDAMAVWPVKDLQTGTEGAPRLWFVFFTRAVEEYAAMETPHPVLAELRQEWRQMNQATFGDLEVILFERR